MKPNGRRKRSRFSSKVSGKVRPLFPAEEPELSQQMERLHHLQVFGRWVVVSLSWLTVLPVSLWVLRRDIALLRDFFTWAGVRYTLIFHPAVTIALSLCIGLTLGVLIWQSRNILFGLPDKELKRLQRQVVHIRERGDRHPLWRWVCK